MSKQILITFEGKDNVSKTAQTVEKAVQNVGIKSSSMGKNLVASSTKASKHLTDLGSELRYMSLVASIAAAGTLKLAGSFIAAAKESEQTRLKLMYFAASAGEDLDAVMIAAQKVASTGLVPLTDASSALANLLATGIGLDKSSKLLDRFLDSASVAKESLQDTLGRALEKAALGFRILQERQIDAVGVNFQLARDIRNTAKALGLNAASLSTAEKQQVLYVFLMKETERYVGAANLATMTFSGSLSKLGAGVTLMKATLGNALVPLIGTFAELLRSVSSKITEFAQAFPGLSMIMMTGTTSVVVFTAAIAGLGALIPLLATGMKGLTQIFALFNATTALMALKITLVAAAVGALIYFVLRATGQWDKWASSMKNLQKKIMDTIMPLDKVKKEITEMDKKISKQTKELEKNIKLAIRSFTEGLAEWAKKHDETMSDLTKDINKLEKSYTTSTKKIKDDFSNMMSSLTLDHARKTEDLQRDIDEEVSKGVWADQTKIRNLQRELKRENEDYALATTEKASKRDEDLKDEKETFTEKRDELQKKLDEELALEQKHAGLVAFARIQSSLDVLEQQTRTYSERLEQLAEEGKEIKELGANSIDALTNVAISADKPISKIAQLRQEFEKANEKARLLSTTGGLLGSALHDSAIKATNAWMGFFEKLVNYQSPRGEEKISDIVMKAGKVSKDFLFNAIPTFFKSLGAGMSFQEGGIIPGSPSQPVPIIAHGGETVLPAGVAPITININNPTVRSNSDISRIAEMVKQVLVDNQRYRHVT